MDLLKRRKRIIFTVTVVTENDGGHFHAYCPALKGLHVDGNTEEEARKNAKDAAIAYIKSLIKHSEPIPLNITIKEETQISLPIMPIPSRCQLQVPVIV